MGNTGARLPAAMRMTILQSIVGGFPVYHDGHYQVLGAFRARRGAGGGRDWRGCPWRPGSGD